MPGARDPREREAVQSVQAKVTNCFESRCEMLHPTRLSLFVSTTSCKIRCVRIPHWQDRIFRLPQTMVGALDACWHWKRQSRSVSGGFQSLQRGRGSLQELFSFFLRALSGMFAWIGGVLNPWLQRVNGKVPLITTPPGSKPPMSVLKLQLVS